VVHPAHQVGRRLGDHAERAVAQPHRRRPGDIWLVSEIGERLDHNDSRFRPLGRHRPAQLADAPAF
jgi:hypothetical protein